MEVRSRTARTPDDEREHRKRCLAGTLRLFAALGYDEGAGGHVTARDPEHPDRFWVNPFGWPFALVRVRDLVLVDHAGTVVSGEGRVNPAGFAIHAEIHAARPDVVAAAHTHSVAGRAWSTLRRPLDPITQDACAFYADHGVYADYTGVVLDRAEGKRIAAALAGYKAVILANHGLLTVGGSVEEAGWWFIAMDRCCQVQLLAEAVGRPALIDADSALATREQIGTPGIGRLNFRTMYQAIVHQQAELQD
jgi:ribulose-5-phosphate 4-epimerase/fuculose-1-phosphate aldolase